MTVIAVISMKGGVGKTTVTSNLSATLTRFGQRVLVIDLDPQNALRLHCGIPVHETGGIGRDTLQGVSWENLDFRSPGGVQVLPFGVVSDEECMVIERHLVEHPGWLGDNLANLGLDEDIVILLDTPPGPSVYLQQALSIADIVLVVLLTDAGSYAVLPATETLLKHYGAFRRGFLGSYYVLNQVDASRTLSRDVMEVVRHDLGARLMPFPIHRDEAVSESLAYQKPVLDYDRYAQASQDFEQFAKWLIQKLKDKTA
ncbi:MAG: cellulose synthase operon protein YhjQ [Burkholderiales bacterium]|nr:cellulose synthase operon protein YhjQ [Burkholderiales bacterium]